jgi:hypothetical protein
MFTIKMRDLRNGHENIFETRRVEWIDKPIMNLSGGVDTDPGLLIHYEDGGMTHYGVSENEAAWQCWVMNRDGATVAQYKF